MAKKEAPAELQEEFNKVGRKVMRLIERHWDDRDKILSLLLGLTAAEIAGRKADPRPCIEVLLTNIARLPGGAELVAAAAPRIVQSPQLVKP